ncbi:MAG TPA: hypothetical protein VHL34_12455 [Rhizomicrobium sp.]|jgi:hypothetical protein|nr:hypothetical protein [Rhizomicrobium sp.]
MKHRFAALLGAAFAVLAPSLAGAEEPSWRFTTGADYSTGRYGEPVGTNVLFVPLTAKAILGNWSFRLSTGFLNIHGPADVAVIDDSGGGGAGGAGSGGGVDPTGATIPPDNRNGLGDTTLGVDYTTSDMWGTPLYADFGARLRLPTGNRAQGLGVGATDEILNLELGSDWGDGGFYVSAGRRFLGDSKFFARKDGYQFGLGGWYDFATYYEVGAYYEYRNASSATLPDPKDVGIYLSYKIASEWKLQLDASKGLSSGAATNDIGLYITYRPDGGYR